MCSLVGLFDAVFEEGEEVLVGDHVSAVYPGHRMAPLEHHCPPHRHLPVALSGGDDVYQLLHRATHAEQTLKRP